MNLQFRGVLFERYIRTECQDGIAQSDILRDRANCFQSGLELDSTVGDIDLAIRLGNTILIGELKCTEFPASGSETANYFSVLHKAAGQVRRKIESARERVMELAKRTGWSLDNPSFLGVIVTNQEIGAGHLIEGIPVVDVRILLKYFDDAQLEHGVMFSKDGDKSVMETTRFYSNGSEAEDRLGNYLLAPPQLILPMKWLKVVGYPLLTVTGQRAAMQRCLEVVVPNFTDGLNVQ